MHTDPEALLRNIPREMALCFTGHRPEKLPQGEMLAALLRALYYRIDLAIDAGLTCFYTGMADGIDYEAALYVFSRRRTNPALRVIGVTPCSDYRTFYENHGYSMSHLWTLEQGVDLHITLPGHMAAAGCFPDAQPLHGGSQCSGHCSLSGRKIRFRTDASLRKIEWPCLVPAVSGDRLRDPGRAAGMAVGADGSVIPPIHFLL